MSPPALRRYRFAIGTVALTLAYVGAALLGFEAAVVAEQVTLVWAPSGIALAVLVRGGARFAPGVLAGAFIANVVSNEHVITALAIATGNTLEALLGARFLRKIGFRPALDRLQDAVGVIFASALSPVAAASVGSVSLCASSLQPWSEFAVIWRDWWLGDAMGILTVAPVLLTWSRSPSSRWIPIRAVEGVALLLALLVVSVIAFGPSAAGPVSMYPVHYLAFPVVIWAALRFGPRGAASVVVVLASVSVIGMTQGFGPALLRATNERLLLLQLFVSVVAITGLLLSASIAERNANHEALQVADQKKDQFLATLAHELRNPLAPIAGAVELMRNASERATTERLRSTIERQLTNIVRLVDDLLDVSRITSGKVQLHTSRVDLASIIENAVEISKPLIEAHAQQLDVQMPAGPVPIEADPLRLAQVVSNLLNNAANHGMQGRRIWLSVDWKQGEAEVVIRVRDEGVGMSREVLAHAFEPFAQGPTTSRISGLGVGLALARQLVTLHGGSIVADSAGPGRGSEFTVRLPSLRAKLGEAATEAVRALEGAERGKRRRELHILVADDNVDAADMLAALLEMRGHRVTVAQDGAEALEHMRRSVPDVALLDIEMPGMTGYEVAHALRGDPGLTGVRLIAISGYGQERDRQRSREAGFDEHMVKPVNPETLYAVIEAEGG